MNTLKTNSGSLIVGKPALLVIDVQGDISSARHDPVRDFPMPN